MKIGERRCNLQNHFVEISNLADNVALFPKNPKSNADADVADSEKSHKLGSEHVNVTHV